MKYFTLILLTSMICFSTISGQSAEIDTSVYTLKHKPTLDYRGILTNNAVPIEKGACYYHNYYLIYNELEYGFTHRISGGLGYYFDVEPLYRVALPLSIRARYTYALNPYLSVAAQFQGLYFYDFQPRPDFSRLASITMTYRHPRFSFSLSGGQAKDNYSGKNAIVLVQASFRPKKSSGFTVLQEYGFGSFHQKISEAAVPSFLTGIRFGKTRWWLSLFAMTFIDPDIEYTFVIPGALLHALLRKPKPKL